MRGERHGDCTERPIVYLRAGRSQRCGHYAEVLAKSSEETMFGMKVRVLSVDGLIAAKKAAGRLKDQAHLLELIELKKILDAAAETQGEGAPSSPA